MKQGLENVEQELRELVSKISLLKQEVHKSIVGQDEVIDQLIIGMLARGHVLIEGLPGLAKTLMIKSLSQAVSLDFKRIQFTPDLMPTDILGTEVIEEDSHGHKSFKYNKGPVFTNILLADEINRTPPKTQAALLEVMQEYKVTYGGTNHELPSPFFLLATQNPLEQSGTFPLPEAQVDRFLLYIMIDYPSEAEEAAILKLTTKSNSETVNPILSGSEIIRLQQFVRDIFISDELIQQVNLLVRSTRPANATDQMVKEYVDYGAGPRAGQAIILAAKAHALIRGRLSVTPEDIRQVTLPALRHRLLINFKAESDGITTDHIIQQLIDSN
ncbi:MAG: MoxR-like ATPase [Cyclobacteriaceae bacterium]|jgi:MoxR-like ATPase